jgi:hypothetical protein
MWGEEIFVPIQFCDTGCAIPARLNRSADSGGKILLINLLTARDRSRQVHIHIVLSISCPCQFLSELNIACPATADCQCFENTQKPTFFHTRPTPWFRVPLSQCLWRPLSGSVDVRPHNIPLDRIASVDMKFFLSICSN